MKALISLPVILLLAACGGAGAARPESIVAPTIVKVLVPVGCVPENYDAKRPAYVDEDAQLRAASDAAARYQLLWGGRAQRQAREKENEAVISGCPRGSVK